MYLINVSIYVLVIFMMIGFRRDAVRHGFRSKARTYDRVSYLSCVKVALILVEKYYLLEMNPISYVALILISFLVSVWILLEIVKEIDVDM